MTECDEVALNMRGGAPRFATMDEARRYVREQMPDETYTVRENTAQALYVLNRLPRG